MDEKIPFPQIPRYPAEGDQPAEPPLSGSPHSVEESIFLNFPGLARTAESLYDYSRSNSAGRRNIIEQVRQRIGSDPENIVAVLDSLALLVEAKIYPDIDQFKDNFVRVIEKSFNASKNFSEPKNLQKWLTLATKSELYRPLAERALNLAIAHCHTTRETIDFLYNFSLAGFKSNDPEILEKTCRVLAFDTPIFAPESRQGLLYVLATFESNDQVLKKQMEIDGALYYFLDCRFPELLARLKEKHTQMLSRGRYEAEVGQICGNDFSRIKALENYYSQKGGRGRIITRKIDDDLKKRFPYNLIFDAGPLRQWFNEFLVDDIQDDSGQIGKKIDFPGFSSTLFFQNRPELYSYVAQETRDLPPGTVMTKECFLKTLAYLVPADLLPEQFDELALVNRELRQDIAENTIYFLSPRGDLVEISDELLTNLGFNNLLYEMNPSNKRQTMVTVGVNEAQYLILLDEFYNMRTTAGDSLPLAKEGAFLEHLILSHLRELRCVDKVKEAVSGHREGYDNEHKRFISRRAHRRILPLGQSPTPEQIERILKEYEIDLVRMNREREARSESRRVTFVFEANYDISLAATRDPLRLHVPAAMARLRQIIAKIGT